MSSSSQVWVAGVVSAALALYPVNLSAQDQKPAAGEENQTVSKPLSKKEREKREKALVKELQTPYKKW